MATWSIVEASEKFFDVLAATETEGEQIIESGGHRYVLVAVKRDKGVSVTAVQDFLRKGGPLGDDEEFP